MTWTFDPLQSLNAHFNFGKLGVVSDKYYVNYYGEEAASFLHQNGTDRLWVTWLLNSDRVDERLKRNHTAIAPDENPLLVELDERMRPVVVETPESLSGETAAIAIPSDISSLEHQDRELAGEWRRATRNAFTRAIDTGFLVEDFYRVIDPEMPQGVYVLRKNKLLTESLS
jgi:predicted GNAT superfamily acetyltransferase